MLGGNDSFKREIKKYNDAEILCYTQCSGSEIGSAESDPFLAQNPVPDHITICRSVSKNHKINQYHWIQDQ